MLGRRRNNMARGYSGSQPERNARNGSAALAFLHSTNASVAHIRIHSLGVAAAGARSTYSGPMILQTLDGLRFDPPEGFVLEESVHSLRIIGDLPIRANLVVRRQKVQAG